MTNVMKNEKGFTLLEIIVVLAVLGALAAMLSPVVFRYIDDANRARAQADTRTIATAIQRMYADTGRWAFYADGNGSTAYVSTTDASFLSSDPNCAIATGTLGTCDGSVTYDAGASGWTSGAIADSLVRHLVTNTGGVHNSGAAGGDYSTQTGFPRAWKGPYTDAIPSVDAWGNPYLVNIGGAGGTNAVIVLSPGPNGIVETDADAAAASNLSAGNDDIISRVK